MGFLWPAGPKQCWVVGFLGLQTKSSLESVSHAPPFPFPSFRQQPVVALREEQDTWGVVKAFLVGVLGFRQAKIKKVLLQKSVEFSYGNYVSFFPPPSEFHGKGDRSNYHVLITATHLQKPLKC